MSCPIGYTCPTIDGVIKVLQESVNTLGTIIDDLSPVVQESIQMSCSLFYQILKICMDIENHFLSKSGSRMLVFVIEESR